MRSWTAHRTKCQNRGGPHGWIVYDETRLTPHDLVHCQYCHLRIRGWQWAELKGVVLLTKDEPLYRIHALNATGGRTVAYRGAASEREARALVEHLKGRGQRVEVWFVTGVVLPQNVTYSLFL